MGDPLDEQVFHEKLKKIRWCTNREDLHQTARSTLQLLLRRPGDQKLLNSLLSQLDGIIRSLPSGGERQTGQIRQAAVRCVVLLQSAKKGRLTRAQQDDKDERWRHRRVQILVAAAVAVAALYLVLLPHQYKFLKSPQSVGEAMQDVMKTSRLGLTKRDNITVRATHEHTIVTAERLTPEDCIAAAKEIQKMGDLTINDTAVGKPNDTKFNSLCHQMGDATLTVTVNQYRK